MLAHRDFMDAAVAQSGLDDFGDDSFREGLEILVRSLREEARLNSAGEAFVCERIARHLAQRLQVEHWYRQHPETDDVPIVGVLFGLGLPRTGSTALSFLLAQDSRIRYLRQWESFRPCPPPSTVDGPDPRITPGGAKVGIRGGHVPGGIDGPTECQDLMALDFKSQVFQAFAQIPSYSAWLLDTDLSSTYLYERRVLKLLQWGQPPKRWRLKAPSHILFLQYLDRAFPDARFVMTHRDPTDVLVSVADLYADIVGAFTDHLDPYYLGQLNVEQWSVGISRALKFRDGGAGHRFWDIGFRAMQADPVTEVRRLYQWLGEPTTDEFESAMRGWWTASQQNRKPGAHPDPATFGLDLTQIRPLFADYITRSREWTAP
jgi:Sulfotransferase family